MQRIIVQLDEHDLAELDEAADQSATSRAALIRQAVAMFLGERRRGSEIARVVASYTDDPPEDLVPSSDHQHRAWPA